MNLQEINFEINFKNIYSKKYRVYYKNKKVCAYAGTHLFYVQSPIQIKNKFTHVYVIFRTYTTCFGHIELFSDERNNKGGQNYEEYKAFSDSITVHIL